MKFDIWGFFEKLWSKFWVSLKSENNGYCTWRPVYIICHWIILGMESVPDKSCRESQNVFPKIVPLWDNEGKWGRAGQATDNSIVRRVHFVCWISKATDTHLEYIILIAFPRKQWLGERALAFHYTYIAWLVI